MPKKYAIFFLLLYLCIPGLCSPPDSTKQLDDSLSAWIDRDLQRINVQMKLNETLKSSKDSSQGIYVFHSGIEWQLGGAEKTNNTQSKGLEPGKYIYFEKVNPGYYEYYAASSSDEVAMNKLLSDLDREYPNGKGKVVLYITSIFTYPEATKLAQKDNSAYRPQEISPEVKQFISKCNYKIKDNFCGIMRNACDYTIVPVIKITLFSFSYNADGTIKDQDYYSSMSEKISQRHVLEVIPSIHVSTECIKQLKSNFAQVQSSLLKEFIPPLVNSYRKCVPGWNNPAALNVPPLDKGYTHVPMNCLLATSARSITNAVKDPQSTAETILEIYNQAKAPYKTPVTIGPAGTSSTSALPTNEPIYAFRRELRECLPMADRIKAIELLLTKTWVRTPYENCIIEFLANIEDKEVDLLLNELKKNNLINRILSALNDNWFGISDQGSYTSVTQTLMEHVKKSPTFINKLITLYEPDKLERALISWGEEPSKENLTLGLVRKSGISMSENGQIVIEKEYLEKFEDRIVELENDIEGKNYYSEGKDELVIKFEMTKKEVSNDIFETPIPNTKDVLRYTVRRFYWRSFPSITLDPFEPILFVNHSNLSAITSTAGIAQGEMTVVPAIFLEYARQKDLNDKILTTTMVAIDIATLVSGAGALTAVSKLSKLRKAYIIFEMANASANLALNLRTLPQEFNEIVAISDGLLMATAVFDASRALVLKAKSIRGAIELSESAQMLAYKQRCVDFVTGIHANEEKILRALSSNQTSLSTKQTLENILTLKDDVVRKGKNEFNEDWSALGKVLVGAGKWLSTVEMRTLTNDWASIYRQGLTSNTQLSKFNKACAARWKNATNSADEVFYGRNGGILNTQSTFPTISAEKGLGIHPTLQSKLPANTQWPNVANCAECDAVNQALWKGAKWEDIQIHTIDIRPDGTMTDVIQCSECLNIFSGMRVTSQ